MLKQEFNNKRYIYILFYLVKRIKIVHRMRKKQLQSINIEILPLRFVKLLILIDGNQLCLYVMPNTQVQNAVEKKQIFSKIGFCCQSETRVHGMYFYVFFLCFQFLFNYFPFFIPCLNIKKMFYTDWCTTLVDSNTFAFMLTFCISVYFCLIFVEIDFRI